MISIVGPDGGKFLIPRKYLGKFMEGVEEVLEGE